MQKSGVCRVSANEEKVEVGREPDIDPLKAKRVIKLLCSERICKYGVNRSRQAKGTEMSAILISVRKTFFSFFYLPFSQAPAVGLSDALGSIGQI